MRGYELPRVKMNVRSGNRNMRRPVKLDFKPLSLEATAKELGIPRARALKIMQMFGLAPSALNGRYQAKSKTRAARTFARTTKASR
jgi:hypothetical protein